MQGDWPCMVWSYLDRNFDSKGKSQGVATGINSHLASLQTIEATTNLSYMTIIIYINMNIPRLLYFYKGVVVKSASFGEFTIDTHSPQIVMWSFWSSSMASEFVHILHSS